MEEDLIAPCGMNCAICAAYLARRNDVKSRGIGMPCCSGCRPRDKRCAYLKKYCGRLGEGGLKYCYQCPDFPCRHLQTIDRRYRARYRMSMIENLEYIRENGVKKLLEKEALKWRCPRCGGVVSCHNGICFNCGLEELKSRKSRFRWEEG